MVTVPALRTIEVQHKQGETRTRQWKPSNTIIILQQVQYLKRISQSNQHAIIVCNN